MRHVQIAALGISIALCIASNGCSRGKSNPEAEAPPPVKIEKVEDRNVFQVERSERFKLIAAAEHIAAPELKVTGTVMPDISRAVPVISIATGRVVEINARLGDMVKKGQLLLKVQSADIAGAYSDYQKALADEKLANTQLERAKILFDRSAILDKPSGIVEIRAPISGYITDQQVTNAAGVPGLGSPNPFTISDLSTVWIICDVYENNLASVRLGDKADIRLSAYPNQVFTGTISNIGPVLDPNIRAVKVRIQMDNPGLMRPGMFVTATFHGREKQKFAAVPATAILHLHDREWVYVPVKGNEFRRTQVISGDMLPEGMQ